MCGIGGFRRFGERGITRGQVEVLLCELESRGNDATGVCVVNGNDIHIHKDDEPAWRFCADEKWKAFAAEHLTDRTDVVMCHTRAWTKGTPVHQENNHPLYAGEGAVVHNGVIWNDDDLFKVMGLERKAEVDTDILRAIIDKFGLTPEGVKQLNRVRGSAAIAAVHPRNPGELLLARSGSPICVASTPWMLGWASTKDALHKAFRPYFERFGLPFQANSSDVGFGIVPDNSAVLIRATGNETLWHREFKLTEHYNAPTYATVHTEYGNRKERAARAAEYTGGKAAAKKPHLVECPNQDCKLWVIIQEKYADIPLWEQVCTRCNTVLEAEPTGGK